MYEELMDSILTAQREMIKHCIEANSVTLNGKKYGKLIEKLPSNMKPTIFGMAAKVDYAMPDEYDFLVQYEPPNPITNADRIRAMSDEELAEFLDRWELGDIDYSKTFCSLCEGRLYDCHDDCLLGWLRQGAEDGETAL